MKNTMIKIFSIQELAKYLADIGAYECRIHAIGYEDGEISEDPIKQIFGVTETIEWIMSNPAYSTYGEMTGYDIVTFGKDGNHIGEIIF